MIFRFQAFQPRFSSICLSVGSVFLLPFSAALLLAHRKQHLVRVGQPKPKQVAKQQQQVGRIVFRIILTSVRACEGVFLFLHPA